MALFKSKKRHANHKADKHSALKYLVIAVSFVFILAVVLFIFLFVTKQDTLSHTPSETSFIEHETEVVKKNETITINDPLLGTIEIEAVEGFAKSTYVSDNFITDETGKMAYYIDGEVASCMGVDLSEYQGSVDFTKLKEQGFEFVILRIGGRYYSEKGDMYLDSNYNQYYNDAKEAGLKVGGYFFSQAKNAQEGKAEAQFVIDSVRGMEFDFPIAFDWEPIDYDTARTDNVESKQLTDAAIAFCDTIKESEFKPIIYTNTYLMYYKYDLERLKEYEFWIADYENKPSMYYNFTMWQYNIEGQVDGIEGNVDLNICMKNY